MSGGGFTIPGETGFEELTLDMARRWGADVIRNSDGTHLSTPILDSGLGIYSTLCLIREDNAWARAHQDKLQQNFLMSEPAVSGGGILEIDLLRGYSTDQFRLNTADGIEFWQVFDRTTGEEVSATRWSLVTDLNGRGVVEVQGSIPGHVYTVNFLVIRIWEEISMYNHTTNGWGDRPHLMAVEPRHPEVTDHLLGWLEQWCRDNPETTVVRFTSLFYNFAWFWGSEPGFPQRYADWGSYDFTVTPLALRQFMARTALTITSEDFVNAGRYTSTHNPPSPVYRAWIEFVGEFVRDLGRRCVDIVHAHGKRALVFYDDSWIGVEPHSGQFEEFGFDGIIKAVFSAYEARLCAAVPTPTHELRLHPYLFPVDLEGKPTFAPGGDPTPDLLRYWRQVRRGLLRAPVERIGLGGYLSLVEPFEDFQEEVARIADQHRAILGLHQTGSVEVEPVRVAVVTSWGSLRTWSSSGHFHEHPDLSFTQVLDALAGLPYQVEFISMDELCSGGVPAGVDVLVNAGPLGSAWSGGSGWSRPEAVVAVREWVRAGGGLVGVEDPSATSHGLWCYQLADVFGVDRDLGDRMCLIRRRFVASDSVGLFANGGAAPSRSVPGILLTRADVQVASELDGLPTATISDFGQGRAVYLASLGEGAGGRRLLENAIQLVAGRERRSPWASDPEVDVACFAVAGKIVVANGAPHRVDTEVNLSQSRVRVVLETGEFRILDV